MIIIYTVNYNFTAIPGGQAASSQNKMKETDSHGSVHHNTNLKEMTNKMQLCRMIYYSIAPWLLYMFRAILSLIIRSILAVITASGFIHMYCCRLQQYM
jgi:hypothetical protein